VDTKNKKVRVAIVEKFNRNIQRFRQFCKQNKIDLISINTAEGYIQPLEQFFNQRMQRN
jgi:Tfp pilus assembly PilM family ATPase